MYITSPEIKREFASPLFAKESTSFNKVSSFGGEGVCILVEEVD
jgi:hypothetical protein